MKHFDTTRLRARSHSAGQMVPASEQRPQTIGQIDKWALFRELCTARRHFGLSDRTLTVLNALLTFLPARHLDAVADLVVFPSNKTLSSRAHGMPESTLRRHLAALCAAGVLARRDSPNGKRYARRRQGVQMAFGFDLAPLVDALPRINAAAKDVREEAEQVAGLREEIGVLRRDLQTIAEPETPEAQALIDLHKRLRQRLNSQQLTQIKTDLMRLLETLEGSEPTPNLSGNDSQNERHQYSPTTNLNKSKPTLEQLKTDCPEILIYAQDPIRHWRDYLNLAEFVRGMVGISTDLWKAAIRTLGAEKAAEQVARIVQQGDRITNAGGYLQAVLRQQGRASC